MSDLKIQGEVQISTEGSEAAFDRVADKAGQMAVNMTVAGEKAGRAIDEIGEVAKSSAEKFSRSENGIVASIKRLASEAAKAKDITEGLSNIEFKIAERGLDANRFAPMIEAVNQLQSEYSALAARERELAAQDVFSKKAAEAAQLNKAAEYARFWEQELEKIDIAERKLATQTLFIDSLRKQTDAIGKTRSELMALQAATLGVSDKAAPYIAKLRELETAQVRVAASSPRMGGGLQNISYQLQDMVVQVNGGTDAMRALSMQLPQMLIGFGAAGAAIGVLAALLPNLISAFGGTANTAKTFSDAMSDVDDATSSFAKELNGFNLDSLIKEFNAADEQTRKNILSLKEYQLELARSSFDEASVSLKKKLDPLADFTGIFGGTQQAQVEKFFGTFKTNEQRDQWQQLQREIQGGTVELGKFVQNYGKMFAQGTKDSKDFVKQFEKIGAEAKKLALLESTFQKMVDAGSNGVVPLKEKAKAAKEYKDALGELLNAINAKDSGFDANYVKNVETLLMAFDRGKLSLSAFNDVFARYVAMQPGAVAAEKERAKALDAAWKAEAKLIEEMSKETDSLEKQVAKAIEENEQIGLTKEQLNALKLARLDDAIATKEQALAYAEKHSKGAAEIALIREHVDALKELRAVTASSQVKQANADALKEQADAWKKFTDDIERSLTDSLYRAFENGDSFGKAFAESLKNTFKTMVLKVAVQGVVSAGMSAVGLGSASSAGNLLSSGSSAYNLLSGGSNLYSTFATSSIGETLGLSSMGAGGMGPPALSALGSAMPYVAAALAIASMFSKESTPHAGGIAFGSASGISTPSTRDAIGGFYANPDQALSLGMMRSDWTSRNDAAMSAQLGPVAEGFAKTLDNILKANNLGTGYQVGLAFSADGEDPARGHATITDAKGNIIGSYRDKNDLGKDASAAMQKLVGIEIPQMLLSALEGMDLNDLADTYLDTLNIEGLSAEAAQQALGFVDASDEIVTAFEKLGFAASDINYDLVKAMGGFDAAGAALQTMTQALDQIAASAAGTSDMFGNSIRNVKLSVLDDPGKYAFLDDEAARYRDVLSSLSDTNLISEYAGKLNSTIMEAWGVLNSDQQTAKADEFIGLLEAADKLALSRYDVAKENVTNQAKEIAAAVKEAVKEAMTEVTSSSVTASNAVTAAVERGINVRIDIDSGTAEVGYVGG